MTWLPMTAAVERPRLVAAVAVLLAIALAAPGCRSLPAGRAGTAAIEAPTIQVAEYSAEPVGDSAAVAPTGCVTEGSCSRDFTFGDDFHDYGPQLLEDSRGIVNWHNGLMLGAAAGAAIAIRQDLDGEVREWTARHPERWGKGTEILGTLGEAPYQVPAILAVYGYSLYQDDPELHSLTTSLISAYTIMGLSTVAIKGITDTERPTNDWNDGHYGFPSFHAASSFTVAAVLDEHYGPRAGVPLYVLAGLISWSRIDERDHDLSDVVFGAALGYVVGKSVANQHRGGDGRVRLLPYSHPEDGAGLMLDVTY